MRCEKWLRRNQLANMNKERKLHAFQSILGLGWEGTSSLGQQQGVGHWNATAISTWS